MASVEYRVLGPLEVIVDGSPIDPGSPRQRSVLAILLCTPNQTVSTDRLIDEIWGDSAPSKARHSLQTYVSNLRRLVGRDRIKTRRPGYALDLGEDLLDRNAFRGLVAEGEGLVEGNPGRAAHALKAALELWRGDEPYEGYTDEIPVLSHEAHALREERLIALEHLMDARLRLGEHKQLVPELQDLTALHPYREGLWALLMRALYGSGRQADALSAYETLRTRLVEELGIDPSRGLQELELRILNQTEPTAAALRPDRGTLPRPPSEFVGREAELAEIIAAIDAARLVTVTGPAGIGKTRLAVEAAHRAADRFGEGAYFVDLAAVRSPSDVADAVAVGLGLADQSGRPADEIVGERLGTGHFLLLLDNCEHMSEQIASLAWRWANANEHLRVLATSQDRLDLDGERVIVVPPLPTPIRHGEESDAVRLFVTRARDHAGGFDPSAAERRAVAEICRLLDGLPLAIELAAARARSLSPAEILTRLDDRFALLTSRRRSGPERHQTLRAAVEWSYSLLTERDRTAFERLSVLSGTFTRKAAEAVAADGAGDPFVDILQSLVDRSLVVPIPQGDVTRYRLLETLRLFGLERLREQGELDAMEHRRASVYAAIAVDEAARVRSSEHRKVRERIDAEMDNIRPAFRWAVAHGEHGLAFDLTRPLWNLVYAGARRHLHEGSLWRRELIEATSSAAMRARLLAEEGFTLWLAGDQTTAVATAGAAIELVQRGDPAELIATEVLAMSAATNRETAKAVELAERLVAEGRRSVDDHAFEALALAHIFGGNPEAAVEAVEEVFAEADRRDDPLRRIRALALMGAALQPMDLERSREFLDEAVATTDALGMDWDLAGAVMARAGTRLMSGDVLGGLADVEWACRTTYRVRDTRRLAQTLEILGGVLNRIGRGRDAVKALSAAVSLRETAAVAGSRTQEADRSSALEALREAMPNDDFEAAERWGKQASDAEAASFGAEVAAAARSDLAAE